jgi:hypothetical protein
MRTTKLLLLAITISTGVGPAYAEKAQDWHRTSLRSKTPDAEILHLTIGDGGPDILERWWNGKRVRWLDEGGTLKATDLRGDMVNGVLQIDKNGDGTYDGPQDINIKWCDTDNDGIPDVQAFAVNPKTWGPTKKDQTGHPIWMVFINHDKRGVLGWMDWEKFDFDCWAFTGTGNWLPNYHGNNDFVKAHVPPQAINDPRLNWENPFSFYDEEGKGVSNMSIRWTSPQPQKNGIVNYRPFVAAGFISYDMDGNAGKDRESSYDLTLRGTGTPIDISHMVHPLPNYAGNPKFDPCFYNNEWRHLKELIYMDRDKGYGLYFETKWKYISLVFDEDDDDHRWERVEMLNPNDNNFDTSGKPADIFSTARVQNTEGVTPGLNGNRQSDSLGDRGEFDLDGSGKSQVYIGLFDRKFHLYGAEWGAWTVDKNGEYHGGGLEPTNRAIAKNVGEVVKYTDTNADGYTDRIEYHYDGQREANLTVNLLDYADKDGKPPGLTTLYDPAKLGWKGMHDLFKSNAEASWIEALQVYRAAWRRDLTTPEFDKLAMASSMMQRYQNSYWVKEGVFRLVRERIMQRVKSHPNESGQLTAFLADYVRAYYTADYNKVVALIESGPLNINSAVKP